MTYCACLVSRFLRRHWTALVAIAVLNFVVFFPVAFMGRVVSPNDVFYSYAPWSSLRPDAQPQNLLINDPPTGEYTHLSLIKDDWRSFHWDPYVGSGVLGFGAATGVSTPIILLPVVLVPLVWCYTAMIFVKLNLAFLFAYLWLREECLGRRGAAIGAIVIAAAGVYAVRWLWPITNATILYPALLWLVRRAFNGRRTPIALVTLIAFTYGLAGFPSSMLYGAWLAAAYAVYLLMTGPARRRFLAGIARALAGAVIAAIIIGPSILTWVTFIQRTKYIEERRKTAVEAIFPATHWPSFVDADRLGNPAYRNWRGDPALGVSNNYVESTIYLGIAAIALAFLGLANRRARTRWWWLGAALLILTCMFGFPGISTAVARIPGIKYSALARVGLLLPLAAGYLAAAGAQRLVWWIPRFPSLRNALAGAIAIYIAADLALVAGRFYPYLETKDAGVPTTPVIEHLRNERAPFRIAPFFDYLWPNSSELYRLEDVRSHFLSEGDYRRMLKRLDPESSSAQSTVLQFNSLKYNFTDPLAGMLGIRYYVEHKYIDIIKWSVFGATQPGAKLLGPIRFKEGAVFQRTIRIDAEPFWALEVPAAIEEERGRDAGLELSLLKDGAAVWSRRFTKADANVMNKLYVPVHGYARLGDVVTLRIRSLGVRGSLSSGENASPAESPLYYGRVTTPVIFDRELPDGRLFRNLSELPRFWSVTKFRKLNRDEFLATRDVDYATETVITDDPVMPPAGVAAGSVTLARYEPNRQRVRTESAAPMFLASSEKLTPELTVTIDGRRAKPVQINMLFAGLTVPAGRHEVVFSRRIAPRTWWIGLVGIALWIGVAIVPLSRRRRRSGTRTATATAA